MVISLHEIFTPDVAEEMQIQIQIISTKCDR